MCVLSYKQFTNRPLIVNRQICLCAKPSLLQQESMLIRFKVALPIIYSFTNKSIFFLTLYTVFTSPCLMKRYLYNSFCFIILVSGYLERLIDDFLYNSSLMNQIVLIYKLFQVNYVTSSPPQYFKSKLLIIQITRMSEPKQPQQNNPPQEDEESSSLSFLKGNQQQNQDNDIKRKNPYAQEEKDSEMRKVIINNRRKEKVVENDATYDGTYLYKPGVELPSLYHFSNQSIKIIVASEYIKKYNPELLKRNIYGSETYTSNSDAVCILVHSGFVNLNNFPIKRFEGVQLTCKVIKPKKTYIGTIKNGLLSRSIKGYNGNALKPESFRNLTSLGPMQLLQKYASNMHIPIGKSRVRAKPRNLEAVTPIPQTHIVFNMHNEPAYKYSLFNLADKGFQKGDFLIKKLDTMVLYLETVDKQKYQLTKGTQKQFFDCFKFSKVISDCCDNDFFEQKKAPLEAQYILVIQDGLQWDQIKWGNKSVEVKGKLYEGLRSFKFYKKDR